MSDSSSDSESEKKLDTNLPISSIDEAKESEIEDVTFSKLVYLSAKFLTICPKSWFILYFALTFVFTKKSTSLIEEL